MKVRFHAQRWFNDHAIEVDPEGETVFEVGDHYKVSDSLRYHCNAPQWVQDWPGPGCFEALSDD